MTNLNDVGMRPYNISRVVNTMNSREDCAQESTQQCIKYIHVRARILARNSFLSSNLFKRGGSQI